MELKSIKENISSPMRDIWFSLDNLIYTATFRSVRQIVNNLLFSSFGVQPVMRSKIESLNSFKRKLS